MGLICVAQWQKIKCENMSHNLLVSPDPGTCTLADTTCASLCRPYFLPCAATSLIAALAAVSSVCLMHETLPSIVEKRRRELLQHGPGEAQMQPLSSKG